MSIHNVYRTIELNTKINFSSKKVGQWTKQTVFKRKKTLMITEYLKKFCNPLGLRGMKSITILRLFLTQVRTINIKINSNNCCKAQMIEKVLYPAGDPVIGTHTMETGKRVPQKAKQDSCVIHLFYSWVSIQGNLREYTTGTMEIMRLLCCYSW